MNKQHTEAIEQAIQYMKEHLDEEVTSTQLADHVGYSPYHFTRMFKQVTGISPRQYLSALRIEFGKLALLNESSLLLKVLMSIGFRSQGSFNTRFKQFVGVSPRKFRTLSQALTRNLHRYENQEPIIKPLNSKKFPLVTCHIEVPPQFHGLIFAGLFPRPIPDQRPVVGTAMTRKRTCVFEGVPPGTYYLLVAGIPWSLNMKDYFILGKSLRGLYPEPIEITEHSELSFTIPLRGPLPTDPPIVVNLPLLLFEHQKDK
ncbi:AraC family transcriptional regulator [Paenibacillus sp. N1-5-1-14]|uniref:helix-turn-helix domain-containing protein n=1 Tax=Paenibacillus radicibacter TaxID=2972488 RepID=UPI002158E595|nr:AraC family transcriptional regulator [Paenibacillus radicibacter]MCR8644350.1 AraC family transcriptional regulator [Paenibacillus radicibacter]